MQPQLSRELPTEELCRLSGQNTGNLVYAHAISSHLGNPEVLRFRSPASRINAAGRVGVIQGANQLGAHFLAGAERARRIKDWTVELVILGLGAQSDLAGSMPRIPDLQWIHEIVARAPSGSPNLGVRGRFTLDVLRHHGLGDHAQIIGCPSLFINPDPHLGRRIASRMQRDPRRIAVVAGHESWAHLAEIEASLARLVSATRGSYIVQHGLAMMKLIRGEARDLDGKELVVLRNHVCPDLSIAAFVRWAKVHGRCFFDVRDWIEHCKRFDLVVGTRIHGVVAALQAGVPALCIVHDSRTLELCQTMKVPHILANAVPQGFDRKSLRSLCAFDPVVFDHNRRRLCSHYIAFMERNRLSPPAWLAGLAVASGGSLK